MKAFRNPRRTLIIACRQTCLDGGKRKITPGATRRSQNAEAERNVIEGSGNGQRSGDRGAESRDPSRDQEFTSTIEGRAAVTNTPDLISALVNAATPVRRLRPPLSSENRRWHFFLPSYLSSASPPHQVHRSATPNLASRILRHRHG